MMKFAAMTLVAASLGFSQEKISIPLTDPSRPATVRLHTMRGDLIVRVGEAKEVVVENRSTSTRSPKRSRDSERSDGLKRIELGGTDLNAEEENNVVTISTRMGRSDITILVPRNSNLTLKTMGGEILVEGVQGEIDANSMNGEVTLRGVGGTVIAHSLNGTVKVALDRVDAKPMSFSTMNGDIDVTLPSDVKARFKLRNDHGDVFSDFEMKLETSAPQVSADKGMRKVRFDRTAYANINGGGPEMSFRTVNGEIRIRQKK